MIGKQVLITGATNGIGLAAAEALARLGANIAMAGRNATATRIAAAQVNAAAEGSDSRHADCRPLVAGRGAQLGGEVLARYPRLDVLINNAGAMHARRQVTEAGIELTWAVNHLAPFLLTTLLIDRLQASAPARIITTASAAHRGAHIPFADLNAERSYRGFERYGQTKLANILFTSELARRLEGTGVTAVCFHPGLVATGFNRNNGLMMDLGMTILRPISRSPQKGAETLVWLATLPEHAIANGGYYFDRQQVTPSDAARDMHAARRLWEASEMQCASLRP